MNRIVFLSLTLVATVATFGVAIAAISIETQWFTHMTNANQKLFVPICLLITSALLAIVGVLRSQKQRDQLGDDSV